MSGTFHFFGRTFFSNGNPRIRGQFPCLDVALWVRLSSDPRLAARKRVALHKGLQLLCTPVAVRETSEDMCWAPSGKYWDYSGGFPGEGGGFTGVPAGSLTMLYNGQSTTQLYISFNKVSIGYSHDQKLLSLSLPFSHTHTRTHT